MWYCMILGSHEQVLQYYETDYTVMYATQRSVTFLCCMVDTQARSLEFCLSFGVADEILNLEVISFKVIRLLF